MSKVYYFGKVLVFVVKYASSVLEIEKNNTLAHGKYGSESEN